MTPFCSCQGCLGIATCDFCLQHRQSEFARRFKKHANLQLGFAKVPTQILDPMLKHILFLLTKCNFDFYDAI